MFITILFYILFAYLSLNVLYYFTFSAAGTRSNHQTHTVPGSTLAKIAVFIPAYKEDGVIVDTATQALEQDYPRDRFEVVVIADSMMPETIKALSSLAVTTLEVVFDQSTKTKAINKAMDTLVDEFDIALVLDADNIMERQLLKKVNDAFVKGAKVVQAHRTAKNTEGHLAMLDAVSEEVNNTIFREGHSNLGLSSALIGSGMAFDYGLFRHHMSQIEAIGGFDKELELRLLKEGTKIHYLKDALVYDEKVSNTQVFQKQRTRWIAAQIRYGVGALPNAFWHLITRGNIDYFDKALQFVLLPRLILLGVLVLLAPFAILFPSAMTFGLTGLCTVFFLSLAMAIPRHLLNKQLMQSIVHLPKVFVAMVTALVGFRKAKNNFLHTPHQNIPLS